MKPRLNNRGAALAAMVIMITFFSIYGAGLLAYGVSSYLVQKKAITAIKAVYEKDLGNLESVYQTVYTQVHP